MGGESLMLRVVLLCSLSTLLLASLSEDEVNKIVDQIKLPRVAIGSDELSATPDPFLAVEVDDNVTQIVKPKRKETSFALGAIMNDKVYINDRWYREGDMVEGYKLNYIGTKGVVLIDEDLVRKLFLREKKEGLLIVKDGE
jgi:hypothetical protein